LAFFVCIGLLLRFLIKNFLHLNRLIKIKFEEISHDVTNLIYYLISTLFTLNCFIPTEYGILLSSSGDKDFEREIQGRHLDKEETDKTDTEMDNDSDKTDTEMEDYLNKTPAERIMDDLDATDKAIAGSSEDLQEIKEQYKDFFDENSDKEGLEQVRKYLEKEFEAELKQDSLEDYLDHKKKEREDEEEAERKEQEEIKKQENKDYPDNTSSQEDNVYTNTKKHGRSDSISETEKDENKKKKKSSEDDNDPNGKGGGSNPSGSSSGISGSNPSDSSGPSSNRSGPNPSDSSGFSFDKSGSNPFGSSDNNGSGSKFKEHLSILLIYLGGIFNELPEILEIFF
jgi:hypothetical protein